MIDLNYFLLANVAAIYFVKVNSKPYGGCEWFASLIHSLDSICTTPV